MKNLILIIIVLISTQVVGQQNTVVDHFPSTLASINTDQPEPSYLDLRREYKEYCNKIVIDTVILNGTVKYEIGDGLKLIPKDTVWEQVYCRDYINNNYESSFGYLTVSDYCTLTSVIDTINWAGYSEPSKETFTTKITRKKYCKVKQERESQEGFWEWVNKNYLK